MMFHKLKKKKEEEEKEKKRELIIKYLELIIIFLVVIIIVLLLRNWYRKEEELRRNAPILRGTIAEIKPSELVEYLNENENPIFYICASEEKKCRTFEKELKPFIEKEKLQQDITYLNITKEEDKSAYLDKFNDNYQMGTMLFSYPAFVQFQNKKIGAVLELTEGVEKIKEVENFLRVNGVVGE